MIVKPIDFVPEKSQNGIYQAGKFVPIEGSFYYKFETFANKHYEISLTKDDLISGFRFKGFSKANEMIRKYIHGYCYVGFLLTVEVEDIIFKEDEIVLKVFVTSCEADCG